MDGTNRPSLNMEDVDRALIDAMGVEPSHEFRSRVRARLAQESVRPRWHAARVPLTLAAALMIVAGAMVLVRDDGEQPQPRVAAADVALPAMTHPVFAPPQPAVPRPAPRRAVAQSRPSIVVREPEVLLSASEQAGVRLLFESAATGRLQLPPEMLRDLSLPLVEFESTTEGDNQ
jgi:hypothetical protein